MSHARSPSRRPRPSSCAGAARAIGTALLVFAPAALSSQSQTWIPPLRVDVAAPGADVRTHDIRVHVSIQDGVATTRIEQSLANRGHTIAEADWILPLPGDAVADAFTMTMNGAVVSSEVLDAGKARQIYEEIVRRQRDPGLLEYYGQGCMRARVFPIPPGGTVDVVVQFRHILPIVGDANLHEWNFPLRALLRGARPGAGVDGSQARLTLFAELQSKTPIKTVYSPLASLDIVTVDDHHSRASLELPAGAIPDRDLQLFYGTHKGAFGLDVLCQKQAETGQFLIVVTPRHEWPRSTRTTRLVQFVVDTSGSMQGEKIQQARAALRTFVASLHADDYFNVVPFSTEARPVFASAVRADAANVARALDAIAKIEAVGGTNIDEALCKALSSELPVVGAERELVPITVFVTDGQPTIGTTEPTVLERRIVDANRHGARVFVFGVGDDVNAVLLDRIAQQGRGDRDYVRAGEDIEIKTSALFQKLSHPVLTDVELHVDGIEVSARSPRQLPDLFKGSRLVVSGCYRGSGHKAIRLRGVIDGVAQELVYEANFPARETDKPFVTALWAQRTVAYLLEQIRLHGSSTELVAEVTRIGKEHGIVTPYTSHLIVEEGMRLASARGLPGLLTGQGDELATQTWVFGGEPSAEIKDRVLRELNRSGASPHTRDSIDETILGLPAEAEQAEIRLGSLADAPTAGAEAVKTSVLMLQLSRGATSGGDHALANTASELVRRKIGDRSFYLVGGCWVDRRFGDAERVIAQRIAVFSDEYFEFLRAHPNLAACLAFSSRLVLVLDDGTAVEFVGAP